MDSAKREDRDQSRRFVVIGSQSSEEMLRAQHLSEKLTWPLLSQEEPIPPDSLVLWVDEGPLRLQSLLPAESRDTQPGPIWVDFLSPELERRRRQSLKSGQLLARALGVTSKKRSSSLKIFDATAGMGQDAWIMAWMGPGVEVVAMERSFLLYQMLKDGLRRAEPKISEVKLEFVLGDSTQYLLDLQNLAMPEVETHPYDVIYLDPMFPPSTKAALSRKEMQVFQRLLAEQDPLEMEAVALLEAALKVANERVVVKRPLKAKALRAGVSHSFKGQAVRYDMYLSGKKKLT